MKRRNAIRTILSITLVIVITLIVFLAFAIGPIDRTPANTTLAYSEMQHRLKDLDTFRVQRATEGFSAGFAKVNITPSFETSTAGYGNRRGKPAHGIRDSIYVRAIVVDNGTKQIAIVTADLLLIPPEVYESLKSKLKTTGFSLDNTYLGATHTHNSIGNWSRGVTQFLYGDYEQRVVEFIADKIVQCVEQASKNRMAATLKTGAIPVPGVVKNRVVDDGPKDSLMRVIEIHRADSARLLFVTFTAHATCLYSKDLEISRDYPGQLVDLIESNGYSFAMFMAGSVGSHTPTPPAFGSECIDWMANEMTAALLSHRKGLRAVSDTTLAMIRVPLKLSEPQVKISPKLIVRSWLFRESVGEYPVSLCAARIGNIILLGAPCDFSGEFNAGLDSLAARHRCQSIITSFNGGYIGYLTPVSRYDVDHFETQFMNWYAPGTGEMVSESMGTLLVRLAPAK